MLPLSFITRDQGRSAFIALADIMLVGVGTSTFVYIATGIANRRKLASSSHRIDRDGDESSR